MARRINEIKKPDLISLQKKVEAVAGFTIKNPVDCEQLSDSIFKKTKFYISSATLKRFMGFYDSGFKSSYQTLDILSIYCGHDGWNNFINPTNRDINITDEEITFLKNIFNLKDYNQILDHDETMQMVSRRIAERLREAPESIEKIVPFLAKNKLSQVFYFEHFPDYDYLVSYQYKGYIEYLKHKKTTEAQIFGNCILFFRAFLIMDKELMKVYHQNLINIEITEDIHPMPLGRYYKCLILFEHFVMQKSISKILQHIYSIEKRLPRIGLHFKNFPGFHYFVADSLILCGYYKDTLKLIELATKNYTIHREFVWKGYYRQFQLMMAEANYRLNRKWKSLALIEKINPSNFYFISQTYFTVRYNLLFIEMTDGKSKANKIKETKSLIVKHQFLVLSNFYQ